MKELILILANSLNQDEIMDELEEAVNAYKINKTKGWSNAQLASSLILSKEMIGDRSLEEALNDLNKSEKAGRLLNTEDN